MVLHEWQECSTHPRPLLLDIWIVTGIGLRSTCSVSDDNNLKNLMKVIFENHDDEGLKKKNTYVHGNTQGISLGS